MSETNISPPPTVDPYDYLQIVVNSDGSLTRNLTTLPEVAPAPDPNSPTAVISKDISINPTNQTWARLYLPRDPPDLFPSEKLPLLVYIHGGGFILCSAASSIFHEFCENIALKLRLAVLSIDYRLCPEHRLPAAYDDAVEALYWIKTCEDDWLTRYVDLSNCYIMGSSAGGTIVYHAGLRVADGVDDLDPLRIKGLILHQPFFGGVERSGSELRLINDASLPPFVSDVMWELSLPLGVDRDHEYCNPTVGGGSKQLEKIRQLGWKILVVGCDGDPLIDRQIELAKLMEEKGLNHVVSYFTEGGYHGAEIVRPLKSRVDEFFVVLKNFIFNSSN